MWDKEVYFRYMGMTPTSFERLLRLVGERTSKQTILTVENQGLAPLANCECGASEQTADHIISQCP